MIRACEGQNCIAKKNQQPLVYTLKQSGQWLFSSLDNNSFSHPLPELSLRGPKLFPIAADDKRSFPFSLFLLYDLLSCNTCFLIGIHKDTSTRACPSALNSIGSNHARTR